MNPTNNQQYNSTISALYIIDWILYDWMFSKINGLNVDGGIIVILLIIALVLNFYHIIIVSAFYG